MPNCLGLPVTQRRLARSVPIKITLAHPRRPGRPSMPATELTTKLSRYFRRRIAGNGSTLAVPSSSSGS